MLKIKENATGREFFATRVNWNNRYSRGGYTIVTDTATATANNYPIYDRTCVRNNYAYNR